MAVAGGIVNGVLMEASVLLTSDHANVNVNNQEPTTATSSLLRPGANSLLRKLQYSKIPAGVLYEPGLSAPQVGLLEEMAQSNLFSSMILRSSSIENVAKEISLAWSNDRPSSILVVSNHTENPSLKLKNSGWITVILCSPGQGLSNDVESAIVSENSSTFLINKLEELPLMICSLNKKAEGNANILVVGYKMKPSREEDFAKVGSGRTLFLVIGYLLSFPSEF